MAPTSPRRVLALIGSATLTAAIFATPVFTAAAARTGYARPQAPPPPPAAASTSGWSVQPTPNPRARTGQFLFGTCTSASSCTAVGTHVPADGVGVTLAQRWNGTHWHRQPTPNPARAKVSSLFGIACTEPSACTGVGGWVSGSGRQLTLAERWNGTRWRIQRTPHPPGSQQSGLFAVACPSAFSCTAVGQTDAGPLAERWNGHRWRIQPVPTPARTQFGFLNDITCTGPSACTAVGQTDAGPLAERWNGHRWRIQPTPNPAHGGGALLGVACTSDSACIAVGASNSGPLAERWNGRRWHIQPTPTPAGAQFAFLNGVDCSARTACTAVGGHNGSSGDFVPLAMRWNGTRWRIQHTPSPGGAQGNFLFAVACPARGSCTAFGFSHGSGTPLTMAQRWTGHTWRVMHTRNPVGAGESALAGVSCTGGASCIAVGTGADAAMAQRWNGTRWRLQRIPTLPGVFLSAVSCPTRATCFAVGGSDSGVLAERWNGRRWHIQPIPTPGGAASAGFGGITCLSASFCMATGAYSTGPGESAPVKALAETWNGHRWIDLPIPNPAGAVQNYLGPVSCTSPSACTTTGEQHAASGTVHTVAERWNGTRWRIQPTPNPKGVQFASLPGVACTGPSACLAVGSSDRGTLAERWNGTRWRIEPVPNPGGGSQLTSLACSSATACTAVGFNFTSLGGTLLADRWNGNRWHSQPTPLLPAAHDISQPAVACPENDTCTAVGGYENDGPGSVTLAERWNGTHHSARSRTQFAPSPTRSPVSARPSDDSTAPRDDIRSASTRDRPIPCAPWALGISWSTHPERSR